MCVTLLFNHQREFPPDCVYKDKERKPGQLPIYTKQNIDVVGRQCQRLHSVVLAAKWMRAERSGDLLRWSALSSLSRPQQTAAWSGAEGQQWPLIYVSTPPSSTCLLDLFLHTAFKVISTVSPWLPQSYKSEENRPVILVNNAWDQLSLKTKEFWRRPSHAYGWGRDQSTNLLGSP